MTSLGTKRIFLSFLHGIKDLCKSEMVANPRQKLIKCRAGSHQIKEKCFLSYSDLVLSIEKQLRITSTENLLIKKTQTKFL